MYRTIWWAFGHSSQQINVAAHMSIWYAIAAIAFGAKRRCPRRSAAGAFLLYILFLQLASAHHLLADPGLEHRMEDRQHQLRHVYLAVLACMIHGLTVPGSIEVAQRQKGYNKGLFEWLRKAPWGNPVFSGMFMSLIGFGFLGGISGVVMGTEQLNMHYPQHHLRARPFPCHGGHRHHAGVHGADLLPDPGAVPARNDHEGPGQAGSPTCSASA